MTPAQPPDTYVLPMTCANCGHHWRETIPRGVEAGHAKCPNCGCRTGRRMHEFRPTFRCSMPSWAGR